MTVPALHWIEPAHGDTLNRPGNPEDYNRRVFRRKEADEFTDVYLP